jgi:predicted Zn-dependent peptidase
MKDNPTVTVMVLVEAGSKYETKKISGISHFLEHMCFKGTERRPKPIDIVKELDGIGAQYNAFTSQEMTGYYAKSDRRHFDTILDVVSDIYLHSTLPAGEIEKEKGVIVEEIKMYEDLPPRHIHDVLMRTLYGEQPAGWDVAGTEATVKAVTRTALSVYRKKHYVSGATAVVVAGAAEPKAVEEKVLRAFTAMPSGKKHGKTGVKERQEKPNFVVEFKETDQVHLAFGLRTFDLYHKDMTAMRVLAAVLGGGMSSRLFQKMRDELGICYYIGAAQEALSDHGFLEMTAGVPAKRLSEAINAILKEVQSLKKNGVTEEELKRVKEYLVGTMYLGLESSDSLAEFYGYQEIMRRPLLRPDEVAVKVRAVTPKDISRIANAYLIDANLNLALIGPVKNGRDVLNLLHI